LAIIYSVSKRFLVEDVQRLFKQTTWAANRSNGTVHKMLNGSYLNVGAWDGERLVGYARIVGDGVLRAFIEDVVVDEALRGQGIGTGLMQHTLGLLHDIEGIRLDTDAHNIAFYEKFGFEVAGNTAMRIWRGK
jgi:ribosomal protein S18 acetylase RimI-like enzyme